MQSIADLVPNLEMLMCGDEAHNNERTSNRNRQMDWSHQGTQCVPIKYFVQGKRFSILPIDGIIIMHDIIEGLVTSEIFVEFLRELVVFCYVLHSQDTI